MLFDDAVLDRAEPVGEAVLRPTAQRAKSGGNDDLPGDDLSEPKSQIRPSAWVTLLPVIPNWAAISSVVHRVGGV